MRVDVLQIVDQLREIFDRVDVVVRRRGNESHARDRVAHFGDHFIDFVAGKLAAFAGLGALRHLDLQLVGIDEVIGGDTEAAGGDLFDGAAAGIAVGVGLETRFVFAAFAGIGFAAHAVHGDGQRLVGFLADGAERHGAGGEALDDFARGLDFFERHGFGSFLEFEEAAQGAELLVLLIDEVGVFLEGLEAFVLDRVLQLADGERIEKVVFAAHAVLIIAADGEFGVAIGDGMIGERVLHDGLACQDVKSDAFNARRRAGKVTLDQILVESDGFENLRAAITLQSRNAHLREDFQQSFVDGLDVVIERPFRR